MSSTRNRNKFCLSLDNSSTTTTATTSTVHLNRWSEVVPPRTALTFAALWDPQEGMVTFSGAALLESENSSGMPSHPDIFDDDGHSQFISVDRDSVGCTTSENTATLATFQDAFKAFLHRSPWDSREHLHTKAGQATPRGLQTRASSTFDGLDVYSHDIQIKPRRSLQLSCSDLLDIESSFHTPSTFGKLRLRSDLMLDLYRPESEERAPSSENGLSRLKSHFSTTTTSTSNYVDVTGSAAQCARSSEGSPTPDLPDFRQHNYPSPASSWPSLPQRRRVLRKRRPWDSDATHSTGSIPSTPRKILSQVFTTPLGSPSSSATTPSPSSPFARAQEMRGRFPSPIGLPISPVSTRTPAPTLTPPATPSKGFRFKLRFTLLPKRKSRQTPPDSDGWVVIEVTPIIKQRFMADLDPI